MQFKLYPSKMMLGISMLIVSSLSHLANAQTVSTLYQFPFTGSFPTVFGIDVNEANGDVYLADKLQESILKVTAAGVGSVFVHDTVQNTTPTDVKLGPNGLLVMDNGGNRILNIAPNGIPSIFAKNGTGNSLYGTIGGWNGIAVDTNSGEVYAVNNTNYTVDKISADGQTITSIAGKAGTGGYVDANGSSARFIFPYFVAVDGSHNVYVADNHAVRKITPTGDVSTLAGNPKVSGFKNGAGDTALFYNIYGIDVDRHGNVFVADNGNSCIRMITPTGMVSTYAGLPNDAGFTDGDVSIAKFKSPTGLAVDKRGYVYVYNYDNISLRVIAPKNIPLGFESTSIATVSSSIYPNPSNGTFNVELAQPMTGNVTATISNSQGLTVQTAQWQGGQEIYKVDISSLSSGVYVLEMNDGLHAVRQKVIKK